MSIVSAQTLLPPIQPQRAGKNEPDLKAVVVQQWCVYVFMKSPALVTVLNSFNHSAINQAKVYYWIITCIINCLAIQAFDPAANNVYMK